MSLTVLIPVKNEELHLAACLDSVVGWAERVVVIDSASEDRTPEILRAYGERGVESVMHAYEGPADQKNWALDELGIDTEWVLFLDADERVGNELRAVLLAATRDPRNPVAGYFVNRRIIWCGRWMRHGGWYPNWNLRLIRRGRGRYEHRRVHEHMQVDGPVAYLAGDLMHEDLRDLTHAIAKHNRYSSDEAREYLRCLGGERDPYARLWTRDALARRRWVKMHVWARLPCKALLYFLWCYVLRLGFLDGAVGLRFHLMHSMFKQFDELKLWELGRVGEHGACDDRSGAQRKSERDVATEVSLDAPTALPCTGMDAVGSARAAR